jgi:ABC-type dipeptide/oligopeptide/nickel transport system permease subunit
MVPPTNDEPAALQAAIAVPGELAAPGDEAIAVAGTLWGDVWRRLRRDPFAILGAAIILGLILVALFAPVLALHNPTYQDYIGGLTTEGSPMAYSSQHPLGTDNLGRDVLSRLIYGARVSLVVGVLANGLALLIGVALGTLAGYFGRWVDVAIMRLTDTMLSFPVLLFAVALGTILHPGVTIIVVVIGVTFWTWTARIVRGQVLSLREKEFVEAARSVGASHARILVHHIMPQLLPVVIVYGTLGTATAILFEASLSYLGAGVQDPTPAWGKMASDGASWYHAAPWLITYPVVAIVLTVLGFNLLGDGLRDALDPKQRGR